MSRLELEASERDLLWQGVARAIEDYLEDLPALPVAPSSDPEVSRRLLQKVDFGKPMPPEEALAFVLEAEGFPVVNRTPLPVVCFQDGRHPEGGSLEYLWAVADAVVGSGEAWVSTTLLGSRVPALRACISSFRTSERDLDALVQTLDRVRRL